MTDENPLVKVKEKMEGQMQKEPKKAVKMFQINPASQQRKMTEIPFWNH